MEDKKLEAERVAFEAWSKSRGHDVVSRLETGGKFYVSSFTRHAWDIWQARASQPAAAIPEAPAVTLPMGFSAKHVDGQGWIIKNPSGRKWIAYEDNPSGELLTALHQLSLPKQQGE